MPDYCPPEFRRLLAALRETVAPFADVPEADLQAAAEGRPGPALEAVEPPLARLQLRLRAILAEAGSLDAGDLH